MIVKKAGMAPVKQGFMVQTKKKVGMAENPYLQGRLFFIFSVLDLRYLSNHLLTY